MYKIIGGAFLSLSVFAFPASAVTYDYGIFSSLSHTDNLIQSNLPGEEGLSGSILSVGADFSFQTEQRATLAADVNGSFSKDKYSENELDDDDTKELEALFLYNPSSSNFALAILESLQQVATDRTLTQTVNNTRELNTFSVMPSYFISLSRSLQFTTNYNYTSINDGESINSRDVNSATIGLRRLTSGNAAWSINARKQETEFEQNGDVFEQEEGFLGYQNLEGLTRYSIELGRQRVVNELQSNEYVYQSSGRLSVSRQINSFSNLEFFYRNGFGDGLNLDLSNSLVNFTSNDQSAFIGGVVAEQQLDLGYNYQNRDFSFLFQVAGRRLNSEEDIQSNATVIDEKSNSITIQFSDRFAKGGRSLSSFGYNVRYSLLENEFNIENAENKVNVLDLRITYTISPKLETFFEARTTNSSGTSTRNNFDEKRISLGVRYNPRGVR